MVQTISCFVARKFIPHEGVYWNVNCSDMKFYFKWLTENGIKRNN